MRSKIADGRWLAGEERSCSGDHRHDPQADMRRRFLLRCTPLTHPRPAILGCDPWPRVSPMRRRDLILLGGAAMTWPLAPRAQQQTMAVIGLLDTRSPDAIRERLRAYRQGLKDNGYVEGDNVTIVYRWAENQFDRLPELAAELVRRQVAVIATAGENVAPVAKA